MAQIFMSLPSDMRDKALGIWSDFSDMWLTGSDESKSFVVDFTVGELSLERSEAETLLDELRIRQQTLKHSTHTYVKSHKKVSHSTSLDASSSDDVSSEIAANSEPPSVKDSLIENLVKVKYAREQNLLYGNRVGLETLDFSSIKVTHPRLYLSAVQDAEVLLGDVQPVDRVFLSNNISTGLVRDIIDTLEANGPLSITGLIRAMNRRYDTWSAKVKSSLEWLLNQGLVCHYGKSRFAVRKIVEGEDEGISALEQQVLLCVRESTQGATLTQISRSLGFINHSEGRQRVREAVDTLEGKGLVCRGAYNRIFQTTDQFSTG